MDFMLLGELAINGVLVGLMYGLIALGIVLVYKTSGLANLAQGAIAMAGGYVTIALATLAGLPTWAAVIAALALMFLFGMLIERVMLRRMIGQPVIMIIMLTLGLEIFLRGVVPGFFGSAVKRLDLGIPQAPIIIGDILINRAYLIGGAVSALLIVAAIVLFNSQVGVRNARGLGRPDRVLVGGHSGGARHRHGLGACGSARDRGRHPLGQRAGGRLVAVIAADEGSGDRDPRWPRQHCRRAWWRPSSSV